jgi:glycosyltransferase involved in cell wall biosynthesis
VRVYAPTSDRPAIEHAGTLVKAPSIRMPLPGRSEYRFSTGFPRYLQDDVLQFNPDIFHIATPDLLGIRAMKFAQKHDIPVVSSYHTHFSSYLDYYHLGALEGWLWNYLRGFYSQCEQVYVPSESMADVLRQHGIDDNLYLWERGVDTSLFNPKRRSMAWRRELGIGDDEVVVSFISRLVWEKGLDVFADVLAEMKGRGVPHRSLIVGDGPARAELEERLPDSLFLGHLKGEALATAYASSDVFFFPSETETFGNVTLEAMASGLPAVCANATGSRSLIEDGVTGFLAEPRNTDAFLEPVARLVLDSEIRRNMGRLALKRAKGFDWPVILARMNGYYNELLGRTVAARKAAPKEAFAY